MGIRDLAALIRQKVPKASHAVNLAQYGGKAIALDATSDLHRVILPGAEALASRNRTELQGAFWVTWMKVERLRQRDITPVFVFDGPPPPLKQHKLEQSKAAVEELRRRRQKAVDEGQQEAVKKFDLRLAQYRTRKETDDLKRMLRLIGVPVVEAVSEAEMTCVGLVSSGLCVTAASDDSDILPFGAASVIRRLSGKTEEMYSWDLATILQGLKLTRKQFVELCVLLGSDYCPRVRDIGPARALQAVTKFVSIEGFLEDLEKKGKGSAIPKPYPYKETRELFLNPITTPCKSTALEMKPTDAKGLTSFLCGEQWLSLEAAESHIRKLSPS
eukprot:RCo004327